MAHKDKDDDLKKIEQLIEIMKKNDLVELEMKHGDDRIVLKRSQPQAQPLQVHYQAPPGQVAAEAGQGQVRAESGEQPRQDILEIKSPLVGTFYAAPSPDAEPFVDVGSHVEPYTVVCIIEAMKVMNEIKAEVTGTITEVLVQNGQAVEYGQPLFRVRPD